MSQWMLIAAPKGESAYAVEIKPHYSADGQSMAFLKTRVATVPVFSIELDPKKRSAVYARLYASAQKGAKFVSRLLWDEEQLRDEKGNQHEVAWYFDLGELPAIDGLQGGSADLAFALAAVLAALPNSDGYPAFAATGELDATLGAVRQVGCIPAKFTAALATLKNQAGRKCLFYPKDNDGDIPAALRVEAETYGIELCPLTWFDEALERLKSPLELHVGNPYKSLASFSKTDRLIYFGRRDETQALVVKLLETARHTAPALAVLAASGAGKSSFLQAGLVAELERHPGLAERPLRAWTTTPENLRSAAGQPEHISAEQLLDALRQAWLPAELRPALNDAVRQAIAAADDFVDLARALATTLPANRTPLWLFDQAEGLFTLGFEEAALLGFADFLAELQVQGIWLIAALRNDFYHFYTQYLAGKVFKDQHDLNSFPLDRLDDIIQGPARRARRPPILFEPLDEAGDSERTLATLLREAMPRPRPDSALPLLQFVLDELYRRAKNRSLAADERDGQALTLTLADYEALGGLTGAIANRAESIYRDLDQDVQAALPLLLWHLTVPQEGEQSFTAKVALWSSFAEGGAAQRLALALSADGVRLLVRDQSHLRVAHEALFSHWPRAQQCLEAIREAMLIREHVRRDYTLWEEAGQISDLLLKPGKRLTDGQDLLERFESFLDKELVDYLRLSFEAEADRQQQLAKAQRRKVKQWSVAACFFFAATLVAGWYWREAGIQQEQAIKQKSVAENKSQELEVKKDELTTTLARSDFNHAMGLAEQNKYDEALAYLARAIRINNDENSSLLSAWLLPLKKVPIVAVHHQADGSVRSAFSPDGRHMLTALSNIAQVWDAQTGFELTLPMRHEKDINSVVFSPDGRRVLTTSDDHTARVWDSQTGVALTPPMPHELDVNSAVFSPDGRQVITASLNHTTRVWDSGTGVALTLPMRHEKVTEYKKVIELAVFSSDGRQLLMDSRDGTARVWNALTGDALSRPMHCDGPVKLAVFSPDGNRVLTTYWDDTSRVWDARTGAALSPLMRHDTRVNSAIFSPDGHLMLTALDDFTAQVWNAKTGVALTPLMNHDSTVHSAAFSPDGRRVITASHDHTARIWDAMTRDALTAPMLHHEKEVNSAIFSPDGRRVLTASDKHTVRVWDAQTADVFTPPMRHKDGLRFAVFSQDGRRVLTASDDHTARVWDAQTGVALTPPMRHGSPVYSVVFSPDGSQVLTGSLDGDARVWDAKTGIALTAPMHHESGVHSAVFSPDGHRVLTVSNHTARVWDAQTGITISPQMRHDSTVHSAVFSPDGRRVITASYDHTARVWDAMTGDVLTPPMLHEKGVNSAIFSLDGRRVLTASDDHTARVWDAQTGVALTPPMHHASDVKSAVFSSDGRLALTASDDHTARVWDAQTGMALTPPIHHERHVNSAIFSPDGRWILTASGDSTARVWDAETGVALLPPMRHEENVISAIFSSDGHRVLTASWDHTARVWEMNTLHSPGGDFADFLEMIAGYRLDQAGGLESIPMKSKSELRTWLASAEDLSPEARQLIEWLLSDPQHRTVTPNGTQTVEERVQQLIGANNVDSLNKALDYWPGHPLALAKLAAATLREGKLSERETDLAHARLWAELALKYAPNDMTVKTIAEKVLRDLAANKS